MLQPGSPSHAALVRPEATSSTSEKVGSLTPRRSRSAIPAKKLGLGAPARTL